ncbi:hypothetical protein CU669_09030 [Paramagnetospirillum kuznetsovii]|uniref:Uncharacterized protein n=1 Tax=Paramagnetospirillum kuznetsovii TaxID=2053833 RepID=A0A364NYV7_9PROT|nr:hypothetical protein [Paramagnetospirillum kuznetsovii]RAU22259.1 hypothetical protein CU669_09030 [Paramagnetospirillum kuznetsovii]
MTDSVVSKADLLELLARWQAFSELQQNAFAFLASEAIATGEEFENSTSGAAQVLSRMGDASVVLDPAQIQAETFSVVHRLQAADRSRQGLEQVASVLETLRVLEADLVQAGGQPPLPDVADTTAQWIARLEGCVSLADWRKRFNLALHGRDPGPRNPEPSADIDDELF